jgi:chitinase
MGRIAGVLAAALACASLSALLALAGPVEEKAKSSDRVFACYFGSWAKYRPGLGKFDVENIDPYLCTHVIYGFAGLKENKIVALDPYNDLVEDWGLGKTSSTELRAN